MGQYITRVMLKKIALNYLSYKVIKIVLFCLILLISAIFIRTLETGRQNCVGQASFIFTTHGLSADAISEWAFAVHHLESDI